MREKQTQFKPNFEGKIALRGEIHGEKCDEPIHGEIHGCGTKGEG